ncbi:MAG: hypothetical protein F4039_00280 [Gammaproteobacteria bacterium]|nr:hypothetical protein [Gammaproteobacteria bacterium]
MQVVGEWITNLPVTAAKVAALVLDTWQRWAIENEVFQTMKDQKGLNFEHNFVHGGLRRSIKLSNVSVISGSARFIDHVGTAMGTATNLFM